MANDSFRVSQTFIPSGHFMGLSNDFDAKIACLKFRRRCLRVIDDRIYEGTNRKDACKIHKSKFLGTI